MECERLREETIIITTLCKSAIVKRFQWWEFPQLPVYESWANEHVLGFHEPFELMYQLCQQKASIVCPKNSWCATKETFQQHRQSDNFWTFGICYTVSHCSNQYLPKICQLLMRNWPILQVPTGVWTVAEFVPKNCKSQFFVPNQFCVAIWETK